MPEGPAEIPDDSEMSVNVPLPLLRKSEFGIRPFFPSHAPRGNGEHLVEHLVTIAQIEGRVRAAGSTMIPSWSSPRPSSRAEQIIPAETWP